MLGSTPISHEQESDRKLVLHSLFKVDMLCQDMEWGVHCCSVSVLDLVVETELVPNLRKRDNEHDGTWVQLFLTLTFLFLRPAQIQTHPPMTSKVHVAFFPQIVSLFSPISPPVYFWSHTHTWCSATLLVFEEWHKCAWLTKAPQHWVHLTLLFWKQRQYGIRISVAYYVIHHPIHWRFFVLRAMPLVPGMPSHSLCKNTHWGGFM